MKEKISRNKISSHYKSFFELDNMALAENDNLMIDWGESLINELVNLEVEKRIKERINKEMTPENALRYFNNHFDCYTDVDINNFLTTEQAMTRSGVIKMFEMLRSRLTNPDNNPK